MNLDELHKVMKGDMTIDRACDGMTDDFEIGHVSHRADGDYRKVAQGKWVPVKAGGQGLSKEFSDTENHSAQLERRKKADAQAKRVEAVREQRQQGEAVGKSWKDAAEEWIKKNPNYKEMSADDIIKGISEHMAASEKPAAEPKAEGGKRSIIIKQGSKEKRIPGSVPEHLSENLESYKGVSQAELQDVLLKPNGYEIVGGRPDKKGNKEVTYSNGRERIYCTYSEDGLISFDDATKGEPKKPAEQKGGGTDQKAAAYADTTTLQYSRDPLEFSRAVKTIAKDINNTDLAMLDQVRHRMGKDHNATDAIDTLAKAIIDKTRSSGNDYHKQEQSLLKIAKAIGYDQELYDAIEKSEGYNFGFDPASAGGEDYDDLEEASNELKERREQMYNNERYGVNQLEDAAAPARLTRDTKIRLSRIKREQTQDERRTYKIGEISEKTGLQKTANGWREVKKGASPDGGKMSKEDLTKRVGEMLKTDPTMRKIVGAGSAAPKADPAKMSKEQLTQRVSELMKTDKNLQKVVKAAGGTIPGGKSTPPAPNPRIDRLLTSKGFINPPGKDFYVYKNKRGNIYKLKALRYPDGKIMYRAQQPSGLFKDGHDLIEIIDRFEEDYGYFDDVPVVGAVMPRNVAIKENKHLLD